MIESGIFAEGDNTIEITWIDKDADNYPFKTSVTLYVTSSSETFEALKAEWRTQTRPEYKIGQLYEVIRNDLSVSVYDGETNTYRPI